MKKICLIIAFNIILAAVGLIYIEGLTDSIPVASDNSFSNKHTIILDAGHGGEDGGAVADDGTMEKDLNLEIAENISLLFDIFGIDYIKTRNSDSALGNTKLKTIRERKVSDIRSRYEIINSTENSLLLSIHQNIFSIEKYSGTQVFYSPGTETSDIWADFIQNEVREKLQTDNNRKTKPSGDSIFLLHKAKVPSVLVECGFISNRKELEKLKTENYRAELSYCIFKGTLKYLHGL